MRKLMIIITILMLSVTGSIVHAGQFGSPEPTAEAGKASLGVGYFYYSSEWEPDNDNTVFWDEAKVKQNQIYLQASYSFVKNWEAYLRFGGADIKVDDAFGGVKDFEDDFEPFGTVGIKGLVYNTGYSGIGPFFQASLTSNYKDKMSGVVMEGGTPVPFTAALKYKEPWDINFGVAFYLKNEGISLYGGPFLYWAKAKVEGEITSLGITVSDSPTYEEKHHLGGYLGVKVPLGQGFNLEVEGQIKSDFSLGGALTYSF